MITFLPDRETTIQFSTTGDKTKQKYEGAFKVKTVLTVEEELARDLSFDAYIRGSTTLVGDSRIRARALAELEARIVDAPSWFKDSNYGRTLLDKNVVLELALQAMDTEKEFDERMTAAQKKAEEDLEKQAAKKKEKAEKAEKKA